MAHRQINDQQGLELMGVEIDLLRNYPKTPRNPAARAAEKTDEDREIARRFGREFFDGERRHGYGGFAYDPKFWTQVVDSFVSHYGDLSGKSLLDVGCAKGFMLFDFSRLVPGLEIAGIDISSYAIENALPEVRESLSVANATNLPFEDKSFDLVISINTIHNLEIEDCKLALREISRVSRGNSFITVDAFRNQVEKQRMLEWNLTAKTILSVEDWLEVFRETGYEGDYFWFIP